MTILILFKRDSITLFPFSSTNSALEAGVWGSLEMFKAMTYEQSTCTLTIFNDHRIDGFYKFRVPKKRKEGRKKEVTNVRAVKKMP